MPITKPQLPPKAGYVEVSTQDRTRKYKKVKSEDGDHLISVEQALTDAELERIELGQSITEQELNAIQNGQTTTDLELMILGG